MSVEVSRKSVADSLAEIAAADPEADPLAGTAERGGYPLGCSPVSER